MRTAAAGGLVRSCSIPLLAHLVALGVALYGTTTVHAATARFSRLSVQDGLSQSSVESIAEDRYGFLWVGTQEGLNRFDGHQFTVHQPLGQPGRLRDGFIRAITPDPDGNLWVGADNGLQHLDVATGRFGESVTPAGVSVRLNTLLVARDGRLWFAALRGGIWTLPPRGALAQRVTVDGLAPEIVASALAFGADRTLWVAADGKLLSLQIEESAGVTSASSVPSMKQTTRLRDTGVVRVIHVDGEGMLWLGRQGGTLLRFDPRSGDAVEYSELPRFILTIASAGEGRLWIGGKDAGLTRFDPKTREIITYRHEPGNEDSLAENDVAIVHQDSGGSLWVGAWNGGLSRLNLYAQAFRTLRSNPDRPRSLPDHVTKMAEGPDGRLWVMTRNDVLAAGDPGTATFDTIPFDRNLTTLAFAGPRLFAGTAAGLVELDARTGRAVALSAPLRAAGLDRMRIDALEETASGLWIMADKTLFHLPQPDSGRALQRAALPFQDEPTSLSAAGSDGLWMTFAEGVLLHAQNSPAGQLTVRRVGGELTARGRLTAAVEARGVLWLGTARGVGKLDPSDGSVTWMDLKEGFPSRGVTSMLADDAGVLWIPTNLGITRFDPSTGHAIPFGAVQGTQASGYVDDSAARGPSGRFYVAGRGITMFDPRQVRDNPHRPRVLFTALEILHRPVLPSWIDPESPLATEVHAAREVTLDRGTLVFSVEMAAPGVSDPDRVHFVHRLEGFDKEWIDTTADRRLATYTRLAPGPYVLRARARTQSGLWSAREATLRILVLPPWWRTPAAIAAWAALTVLLVTVAVREARRRTRSQIVFAEQDALRRASVTDPLTGLYNRRFLAEWLKHEVPRALRSHRASETDRESLLFVIADLDNLKEINDAFGHDAGDRAILAVARLLESHARAEDLAVRWGGDEYVLVLRSDERTQCSAVVERLRAGAEAIDLGHDQEVRCTISLGFASFPFLERDAEALTWEQTFRLADRALFLSKRRGRNTWTGLAAGLATSAAEVIELLESGSDNTTPALAVRVLERPGV